MTQIIKTKALQKQYLSLYLSSNQSLTTRNETHKTFLCFNSSLLNKISVNINILSNNKNNVDPLGLLSDHEVLGTLVVSDRISDYSRMDDETQTIDLLITDAEENPLIYITDIYIASENKINKRDLNSDIVMDFYLKQESVLKVYQE